MKLGFDPLKERSAKLAARPRCGMGWIRVIACDIGPSVESHVHRCKRISGHANREHLCGCGATRTRKTGKGDR